MKYAILTLLIAVSVSESVQGMDDEKKKKDEYLREDGVLRQVLKLRDSQEGFAGVTGELIEFKTNGAWTVRRFVNDKMAKPHREGKLKVDEVRKIGKLLGKQEFLKLPKSFGKKVPINRHRIEISFGPRTTVLTLVGGESLSDIKVDEKDAEAGTWKRFRCIADAINKIAAPSKKEEAAK